MRRVKSAFVFLLVSSLLLLGCNFLTGLNSGPAANYDIDQDNAIVLAGSQPQTLDPARTRAGAGGPVGAIFSGLVTLDTEMQVRPDLAAGWDVSQEGAVYTFYLRPDASFHDGRPVTAADIIYSWERAANPATGSDTAQTYLGDIVGIGDVLAGQSENISGLRAIDDHTLEVRIDAPKAYFLAKLTYPVAFVVDRHNVDHEGWEYEPNGAGPFALQEWLDDEALILVRNEEYYRSPPALSHILYLIGAGIPLSLYENDQIDLVWIGGGTLERAQDSNDSLHLDLRVGVDMCTSTITLDSRRRPFDDLRVRRAFNLALDKERIISGLYDGNVLPAVGPLPPGMPGYTGQLQSDTFDPGTARDLLAQAGYADPAMLPPITFTTAGYGGVGPLVTAAITMWQENLGVTVEPVLLEPYNYLDELYAGNGGNIISGGWCADYPDPENFLDVLYHSDSIQNLGGYSNPAVDELLERARVESDLATRLDLYGQIEQMIVDDAPVIFLNHSLSAVLVKPHLKNYVLTPIGVPQWHLVEIRR